MFMSLMLGNDTEKVVLGDNRQNLTKKAGVSIQNQGSFGFGCV
jgi:hypothetical protein